MFARKLLIDLLLVASVTGCTGGGRSVEASMPARVRYSGSGALEWKMVIDAQEAASMPAPSALRFRVTPPIRREGDDLLIQGELENPTDGPVVVYLFGVDWEPLTLAVRWEEGLNWKPPCPEPWCAPQPPVPPPPFRITVPPRTVVEFTGRCDLRTLDYHGSPEVTFDWRFGFAVSREAASGTLRFRLPPR